MAAVNDLIWRLVADGRPGTGYHLARAASEAWPGEQLALPPALLRVLCVGSIIRSSVGEAVDDLSASVQELQAYLAQELAPSIRDCVHLLVFTAAMRPVLLAPLTGAGTLLEIPLPESLAAVRRLGDAISGYVRLGLELSPSILKGIREHAHWARRITNHRSETARWLEQNQHANIIYAPTTNVWRQWLRPAGMVAAVLSYVISDARPRADQLEAARRAVHDWSSAAFIERKIYSTDKSIRGRQADLRPISARATDAVKRRMEEAVIIVKTWMCLLELEPDSPSDFRYKQADACRAQVLSHLAAAHEQVLRLADGSAGDDLSVHAAVRASGRVLAELTELMDPQKAERSSSVAVRHVVNGELLHLIGTTLSERWEPQEQPADLLERLLALVADESLTWEKSFTSHCENGDHVATSRIIDQLSAIGEDASLPAGLTIDVLSEKREECILDCRVRMSERLRDSRTRVERAVVHGLLSESERSMALARVDEIDVENEIDFPAASKKVDAVLREIREREQGRVEEARARLQAVRDRSRVPAGLGHVEDLLARGDFRTAVEYLDRAEQGEPIDVAQPRYDPFGDFFPGFAQDVYREFGGPDGRLDKIARNQLVQVVRDRRQAGPLDARNLSPSQAEAVAKMLEHHWFLVRNNKGSVVDAVRQVLDVIGLPVVRLEEQPGSVPFRQVWFTLETQLVRGRDTCIVPQYASMANGRYRLLCLWERSTVEEIVEFAGQHGRDLPLIVIYFGRLAEQQRRHLAQHCRTRERRMVLIDEALLFFLCAREHRPLPLAFRCAFPFTVAEPYITTAGLVPVEMFFGRDREREQILSPEGTSLVYGGRQLGKTALLRDAERRAHRKGTVVVRWVDLRAEGVGITCDIWTILSRVLGEEEILPRNVSAAETFRRCVGEWISADPIRRIVLLLDEADLFLDADSKKGYEAVNRLKGLMDMTNRRFKVVFAGLHNVQRTSRDVNTPLAHLGNPICVGPLLADGEWRHAMDLVRLPFEALGYRFEAEDLILRILSYTNYYPSLIQLFCKHLLDSLNDPREHAFDPRQCPPYKITARQVEDAYQNRRLRGEILKRLMWTLDLDPRYKLIAQCIALASVEGRAQGALSHGFDASAVRDMALNWWPQGFEADATLDAFRTILDEMIGLGVLRKVSEDRYTLRSPNVLDLIGTKEDIETALLEAENNPAPVGSTEASTFRKVLPNSWKRSPLTARQESELLAPRNGVAVVYGSVLAGMLDLHRFLIRTGPQMYGEVIDKPDFAAFARRLEQDFGRRDEELLLLLVTPECGWSDRWIDEAVEVIKRKRSKARFRRIIFVADAHLAWDTETSASEEAPAASGARNVDEYSLQPWSDGALRHFMDDLNIGHLGDKERLRVAELTGRWSDLLHRLGAKCREAPLRWEEHLTVIEQGMPSYAATWRQRDVVEPAMPVLRMMAELADPLTVDDICDVAEMGPDRATRILRWARRLGYADRPRGKWTLDPAVARLVLASRPEPGGLEGASVPTSAAMP